MNIEMEKTSKYRPTNEERETIIRYDDASDECRIYTCNRALIARLDRYCLSNPKQWKLYDKDEYSKTYRTTKKLITIREKSVKKEMTDEQRQAAADRLQKARESR